MSFVYILPRRLSHLKSPPPALLMSLYMMMFKYYQVFILLLLELSSFCGSPLWFLGTNYSGAHQQIPVPWGTQEAVLTLCLLDCRRNARPWTGLTGGGGAPTDPPGSCLHWPRHGTRDHSHHYTSFREGAGTPFCWNLQWHFFNAFKN